jgi:hypothetical protein
MAAEIVSLDAARVIEAHKSFFERQLERLDLYPPRADEVRAVLDWARDEALRPFSFRACCAAEGLDPSTARAFVTLVADAPGVNNFYCWKCWVSPNKL